MSTDYYQLAADARKQNRNLLMAALVRLKVERVIVEYSGSGDSGDFVGISTVPELSLPILRSEQLQVFSPKATWLEGGGYAYSQESQQQSIYDALGEFCMSWVSAQHGGWENNDGGQGTVTIEVTENTFILEHTEFFTESTSYEHSC